MENTNQSKRLEPEVFTAMSQYLKYRYSHKRGPEYMQIRSKLIKQLKTATPAKRQEFVASVDQFLENNKVVIAQAKKAEEEARRKDMEENEANLKATLKKAKELI